jgi:HSP90 family molecular chaperone
MEAVKVIYTVKQKFVETNKKNIERVMSDLRELNNTGIKYSTFLLDDGRTFIHFGMYSDEKAKSVVINLASFKQFQNELKGSHPEVAPKAENLNLIASAYDIF